MKQKKITECEFDSIKDMSLLTVQSFAINALEAGATHCKLHLNKLVAFRYQTSNEIREDELESINRQIVHLQQTKFFIERQIEDEK